MDLNTDPKTCTEAELNSLYQELLNKEMLVVEERKRREALPFVWASELEIIKSLRGASNYQPSGSTVYAKPANIITAYIAGDEVTYKGKAYRAVADGAIYTAPGEVDPARGDCWHAIELNEDAEAS